MIASVDDAVAILERTPRALSGMLGDLPDEWARYAPEGEWSAYDVLGHLIHGEETDWIPRARIILEHGTERPFDPFDREFMLTAAQDRSVKELVETFATLRAGCLADLRSMRIGDAELGALGTHPSFGPVSLGQLVAAWAVHDLDHCDQIVKTLAHRYREAIGPWRAFLPVVDR